MAWQFVRSVTRDAPAARNGVGASQKHGLAVLCIPGLCRNGGQLQLCEFKPVNQTPAPHCLVVGQRDGLLTVGRKDHVTHTAGMPTQAMQLLARVGIPQPRRAIDPSSENAIAIWTEHCMLHRFVMTRQRQLLPAGGHRPHSGSAVLAGGEYAALVRAEDDGGERRLVAAQAEQRAQPAQRDNHL